MSNTFFYNGANQGYTGYSILTVNTVDYWTIFFDVGIFYGPYVGASSVTAVEPGNLPPLQNVNFNVQMYKCTSAGVPTSKFAAAKFVAKQDVFEFTSPANCLGTKFIFTSPVMPSMVQFQFNVCTNYYCLVWSTERIEMPYGADMIFIAPQNGVTPAFQLC